MQEIKNNPQVYTTQEGIEEIKNNPQVYTTQEGMQEIKNNPQVYTTQESMQEIKNYPQDVNTCFYKLNFLSFWNETHLKVVWGWTIRFSMLGGGEGGSFTNCNYVFSSIKPVVDFFKGYCPTTPPPPPRPLSCLKSLMVPSWYAIWSYNFLCDERIWIYM